MGTTINLEPILIPEFTSPPSAAIESGYRGFPPASLVRTRFFANLWCSSHAAAVGAFTLSGRLAKMSDQERWLNEILDILGLPRDTAYRDYTRELAERGASLEQIYGTLRSRMNARLS